MNISTGSVTPEAEPSRLGRWWPLLLIALAGAAVYANSFSGPFVFDDLEGIVGNPTIRHLWPIGAALSPPSGGLTVSGRPVLNLTLALNYAISGTDVWSYHALNLAIHLLAGLTLFGITRRTLQNSARARRGPPASEGGLGSAIGTASPPTLVAFAVALLWTVHPLQTESVTYVIQRAESLMGLFYLLTLYCFIRYAEEGSAFTGADKKAGLSGWAVLSVLACFFGMATKEVMVSAPLVVLLYDRTFVAGNLRDAWRRRRSLYCGLAATWILLGGLVLGGGGGRGGSVGFGVDVPWVDYCLTQFQAIGRYLLLTVWPHPLVFEYGTFWVLDPGTVVFCAGVVAALVAATLLALQRWPAWGFLGFWFFAILAPTSLVPGTTQMIVEHRMYLALAPLLAGIVCGAEALMSRCFRGGNPAAARSSAASGLAVLIFFALAGGALTARRNEDYRTEATLWADTVAKRPENALARSNLGTALEKSGGRLDDAVAQFQAVVRLNPNFAEAHNNLGNAWLAMPGKLPDAIAQFQQALRLKPDFAEAHDNLGKAWAKTPGKADDAVAQFEGAVRLKPDFAEAHDNLGHVWLTMPGKLNEAIAQFQEAVRLDPDDADARNNLGNAWSNLPGRSNEAISQLEDGVRLKPDSAEAHNSLGIALSNLPGRLNDAIAQYREALRLKPDYPEAHNNLGDAWLNQPGRTDDAIAEYREAMRLKPDYAEPHYNLGGIWLNQGRLNEAISEYQEALRLKPDLAEAHYNLGCAWVNFPERLNDAIAQFEEAVRLNPNYAEAHFNLAVALLHASGRNEEAKTHLEAVVRLRPDNDRARQLLALLQAQPQ